MIARESLVGIDHILFSSRSITSLRPGWDQHFSLRRAPSGNFPWTPCYVATQQKRLSFSIFAMQLNQGTTF